MKRVVGILKQVEGRAFAQFLAERFAIPEWALGPALLKARPRKSR